MRFCIGNTCLIAQTTKPPLQKQGGFFIRSVQASLRSAFEQGTQHPCGFFVDLNTLGQKVGGGVVIGFIT